MKISSSTEYGLRLMVRLARHQGGAPLSAEKMAEADNIPRDYVDQLLQRLRRAGLVESRRGASGGYSLSRPPERLFVADVLRAVEGSLFEPVCDKFAQGEHDCRHQSNCGIRSVWMRLSLLIEDFLGQIPLSQLVEPEDKVYTLLAKAADSADVAAGKEPKWIPSRRR